MTQGPAEKSAHSVPEGRDVLNPASIDPEALARMLGLDAGTMRRHIEEGAPVNRDGTLNLIHYAAWLNTEAPRSEDTNEEHDGVSTN